jgi:hypothetical protein
MNKLQIKLLLLKILTSLLEIQRFHIANDQVGLNKTIKNIAEKVDEITNLLDSA